MHPHTRNKTKKQLARRSPRGDSEAKVRVHAPVTPAVISEVDREEVADLADDLAYFRATRYRDGESGDVREEDIERAESEITALLKREVQE